MADGFIVAGGRALEAAYKNLPPETLQGAGGMGLMYAGMRYMPDVGKPFHEILLSLLCLGFAAAVFRTAQGFFKPPPSPKK